jgi:RNA polymerase sigma-70 factor (ECF subfamily)
MQKQFEHIDDIALLDYYYQSNDNKYLGILLQRYTLLLFGTCMKYLKNETNASDAVQQVFLKAINELPKYKVTYFKSWIYMVAKNHCLMQLRKKYQFADITAELFVEEDSFDIEIIKAKEATLILLEDALNELNDDQKICVQLFYLYKKSYTEIATTTGYTLMQVKSHIQNGKRNLKLLIEKKQTKQ